MGLRIAALGLLALTGCFTDIGDASDSGAASEGSTSSGPGAAETTSAETTTGVAASSSSGDPATSSGGAESSDSDGSSSGGQPPTVACWGSEMPWETTPLNVGMLTGQAPTAPTLSPDGLVLHYLAGPPGQREPHRVERNSRMEPFSGGDLLAGWSTPPTDLAQFRVAEDGDRAIGRVGSSLLISSASGGNWQNLSAIDFGDGFDELTDPAFDALGRVVIFARRELLQGDEPRPTLIWALHRTTWPAAEPAPSGPERLELPTFELNHAQLCPALSPDGMHLFLGGSFPHTWNTAVTGDLDVFESASEAGAWSVPTRVDSLSAENQHAGPRSVTDDGCELTLRQFDIPFAGNTFFLARRTPPSR